MKGHQGIIINNTGQHHYPTLFADHEKSRFEAPGTLSKLAVNCIDDMLLIHQLPGSFCRVVCPRHADFCYC